jgi:tol-pal system protein YbgF
VAAAQNASKAAQTSPPPASGLHSLPPATLPGEPTPAIAPAAQTPSARASSSADYDKGLELTRKGDTAGARALFQSFISNNPGNQLTPNAIFWLGETYYVDKQFDQAILSFKEVAGRYPTHAKAAASMLKLGYAYEQLGDRANARFYLRALIDEYPQSEPAKLAKEKLSMLGQ